MLCPQIDDQVRAAQFFPQRRMNPTIHCQFIITQVQPGKNFIFGKGVIGNEAAFFQSVGYGLMLLMVAAEQKEDLGLEGVTFSVFVETGQEWVFLEHFEE